MVLNDDDSSWVSVRMQEAIERIENEWIRPSVLFKPKLFLDGNEWCALLGENPMEGVCAFGDSPAEAMLRFDSIWYKKVKETTDDRQRADSKVGRV